MRSRLTDSPIPEDVSSVHPGGNPTPSSATRISTWFGPRSAVTVTVPPETRGEMP
jgi:hypothetical protein